MLPSICLTLGHDRLLLKGCAGRGASSLLLCRLIMDAKNSNFPWSCGSRGWGHVTMLHLVSWISWISITSSHPRLHQSPILRHAHSWERRTLGTKQKESQMASCSKSSVTSLKPSFQCTPAWIIQWQYPFSLGCGPQQQKEPYCCWFVGMQQLSGEKGNIKKQLIYWSAKEKTSRPGLQWDWRYLRHDLKTQKTWKRWLLVWLLQMDDWREGASDKQRQFTISIINVTSAQRHNVRGLECSGAGPGTQDALFNKTATCSFAIMPPWSMPERSFFFFFRLLPPVKEALTSWQDISGTHFKSNQVCI